MKNERIDISYILVESSTQIHTLYKFTLHTNIDNLTTTYRFGHSISFDAKLVRVMQCNSFKAKTCCFCFCLVDKYGT